MNDGIMAPHEEGVGCSRMRGTPWRRRGRSQERFTPKEGTYYNTQEMKAMCREKNVNQGNATKGPW